MNCSIADRIVDDLIDDWRVDGPLTVVLPIALTAASLPLLVAGKRTYRPIVTIAAGVVSWVGLYAVLMDALDCLPRVIVSAVGGVVALALVAWLSRVAIYLTSAAAVGSVAHYVLDASRVDRTQPTVFWGRSVIYWIVIPAAGILGIFLPCCFKRTAVLVFTSVLGAMGATTALSFAIDGVVIWAWLGVAFGLALASLAFQVWVTPRLCKKRGGRARTTTTSEVIVDDRSDIELVRA